MQQGTQFWQKAKSSFEASNINTKQVWVCVSNNKTKRKSKH